MYLLALPDDVLEKILSYMSYDEVSRCRLVRIFFIVLHSEKSREISVLSVKIV